MILGHIFFISLNAYFSLLLPTFLYNFPQINSQLVNSFLTQIIIFLLDQIFNKGSTPVFSHFSPILIFKISTKSPFNTLLFYCFFWCGYWDTFFQCRSTPIFHYFNITQIFLAKTTLWTLNWNLSTLLRFVHPCWTVKREWSNKK